MRHAEPRQQHHLGARGGAGQVLQEPPRGAGRDRPQPGHEWLVPATSPPSSTPPHRHTDSRPGHMRPPRQTRSLENPPPLIPGTSRHTEYPGTPGIPNGVRCEQKTWAHGAWCGHGRGVTGLHCTKVQTGSLVAAGHNLRGSSWKRPSPTGTPWPPPPSPCCPNSGRPHPPRSRDRPTSTVATCFDGLSTSR